MALQDIIDSGMITEAGIGIKGELCCENCIDEDGYDSTGGNDGMRCGDKRNDEGDNMVWMEVEVLTACDSCKCEVSRNRQATHSGWHRETYPDFVAPIGKDGKPSISTG